MSQFFRWTLFLLLLMGWLMLAAPAFGQLQTTPAQAVVRAVLFYSPTCGHCHYVIEEVLPPLMAQYGDRLQIIAIDVNTSDGFHLFEAAWGFYGVQGIGVPFLAVGEHYLVGSADIPQKFPGLIESYLAQGGLDWPAIPGLAEAVQVAQPQATATLPLTPASPVTVIPTAVEPSGQLSQPATAPPPSSTPTTVAMGLQPTFTAPVAAGPLGSSTPQAVSDLSQIDQPPAGPSEKFQRDPFGNGLAVFVLLGMVLSLVAGFQFFRKTSGSPPAGIKDVAVPGLCLIGMGVAGYLAYVEMTQSLAVCGPVGDCNAVQQSEYARLFGVLPIGVLGIAGYLAILLAWTVTRTQVGRARVFIALAQLGMTVFGLVFSIYLTFLEPFVIGATCAWCLTSAVIMTALFWLSLTPARVALQDLQRGPDSPVLSTQ